MAIKKTTEYAIRIMRYMMCSKIETDIMQAAEEEGIDKESLVQILTVLKDEKIVETEPGCGESAEYRLTLRGINISVYRVIRIMERNLRPLHRRNNDTVVMQLLYKRLRDVSEEEIDILKAG